MDPVSETTGDVLPNPTNSMLSTLTTKALNSDNIANSSTHSKGIMISGQGSKMVEPDLAILNIGVEIFASTVRDSRNKAAKSMDSILASLTKADIDKSDIKTNRFSISPRYDYEELTVNGKRIGSQVLIGYNVNNSVNVKIRNLDKIGDIIDDASEAGGDASRINGITFTVDDSTGYEKALRESAVNNALTKANHYAELIGVTLVEVISVTEGNATVSSYESSFDMGIRTMAASSYSTGISGGESELTLTVNIVFGIE